LVYHSFCWGTSLLLSLLPLSTSSYGRNAIGSIDLDDDGQDDSISAACWLLTAHDASFIWRIIQVQLAHSHTHASACSLIRSLLMV
jgi:hypothetical protein